MSKEPQVYVPATATAIQPTAHAAYEGVPVNAGRIRQTSNPPPSAPDGGIWGSVTYAGNSTNMMCLVLCLLGGIFTGCGTCAYLCPMDKKDAYKIGNKVGSYRKGTTRGSTMHFRRANLIFPFISQVYDHTGRLLGTTAHLEFAMNPLWKPSTIAA